MYAVATNVHVEKPDEARSLRPEAREAPGSRAPGIVCGDSLPPINGIGTSVPAFETKEHAGEAARHPMPPLPGVAGLHLTIGEVFAHV
jgi:hypothetical protein